MPLKYLNTRQKLNTYYPRESSIWQRKHFPSTNDWLKHRTH
jgi:hypothetical protein